MRAVRQVVTSVLLPAALASAGPAARAAELRFELDPVHSFVQFEVRHFDMSTLRGRFGPAQGEVRFDAESVQGRVGLAIDTTTLDTGLRLLDARLRQPDLLDVAGHPQAFFVAERFRFEQGLPVELNGALTVRAFGTSLTLRARRMACDDPLPRPGRHCGGDLEGEVLRSTFRLPLEADRVTLRVQVEGLQQEARKP